MALSDYALRNETSYTGESGNRRVSYVYRPPAASWYSLVPAFNSTVTDPQLGTVYFKTWKCDPIPDDDAYVRLTMEYSVDWSGIVGGEKEDNDDLWLPVPSVYDSPLESHPDYFAKWNHDLYRAKGKDDATPAWASNARNLDDADGVTFQWAKESPGDAWEKVQTKTKPGVETWYRPAFAVQYHFWHATYATVVAALKTVGTLQTPSETFGYSGDWLVTAVTINEDGKKYRGTVEFTHAADWDSDLYS